MEILFNKYKNIQKFILEYRKYETNDTFHDFPSFKKIVQVEQFIKHTCNDVKNGRLVYIFIFIDNSKYIKTTNHFKRLIDKLPEEPADLILISKDELSIYITKALSKYPHLRIFNYMHKIFVIEISKGPMCSKHTILSNNEVRTLCSRDLIIHPLSLPSISINDPQNIWIGGELGQVIKIESISEITGKTIRYRIVSPDSGKIINMQKTKKHDILTEDAGSKDEEGLEQKINEQKDDDVSEYVDNVDEEEDEVSDE